MFSFAINKVKDLSFNFNVLSGKTSHLLADGVDISSRDLVRSGHICSSVKDVWTAQQYQNTSKTSDELSCISTRRNIGKLPYKWVADFWVLLSLYIFQFAFGMNSPVHFCPSQSESGGIQGESRYPSGEMWRASDNPVFDTKDKKTVCSQVHGKGLSHSALCVLSVTDAKPKNHRSSSLQNDSARKKNRKRIDQFLTWLKH